MLSLNDITCSNQAKRETFRKLYQRLFLWFWMVFLSHEVSANIWCRSVTQCPINLYTTGCNVMILLTQGYLWYFLQCAVCCMWQGGLFPTVHCSVVCDKGTGPGQACVLCIHYPLPLWQWYYPWQYCQYSDIWNYPRYICIYFHYFSWLVFEWQHAFFFFFVDLISSSILSDNLLIFATDQQAS